MAVFEPLNEDNFLLFASNHYYNPTCISLDEFYEDIKRFAYLKRLIKRYKLNGDLQERLILNHLIIIYNSFGVYASTKMVFYKLEETEEWSVIIPFLVFLNYIKQDDYATIELDQTVIYKLKNL